MPNGLEATRNTGTAEAVVRGVSRLMRSLGESCLNEFILKSGRRVDIISVDRKGAFTVIEIKSSVADFRADNKWQEYLDFCDRFYFAVEPSFPNELIPVTCGLIIADSYGAEIVRDAPIEKLHPARR